MKEPRNGRKRCLVKIYTKSLSLSCVCVCGLLLLVENRSLEHGITKSLRERGSQSHQSHPKNQSAVRPPVHHPSLQSASVRVRPRPAILRPPRAPVIARRRAPSGKRQRALEAPLASDSGEIQRRIERWDDSRKNSSVLKVHRFQRNP